MSYRVDRSPKLASKVPPMYSPRIGAGGVFASRAVPPSPLRKGLEGPPGSGSSPAVDYDDVFGGPPRFATSMFAAQAGPAPSSTLERSNARTPSFRSSSLPVFELPVFGDDAFSNGGTFEPRPASVAYDDIFREEVHTPGAHFGGNIPQSKPGSRSSSCRMSPVHPAASLARQPGQEETLAVTNSSVFLKGRSNAGNLSSRNSFSSSSFDEGRNKPLDGSSMLSRTNTVGSSLPSSPPHAGAWGHAKKSHGASNANHWGASVIGDVDDVFGGFPQRTYSLAFQAARQAASSPSVMQSAPTKATKAVAGNKVQRSAPAPQSSESYGGSCHTLSSSSSSNGEQDDFIEIQMDRQSDISAQEKVEGAPGKGWAPVSDIELLTQSTPMRAPARPPPSPAPATPLKHKSWKDWTTDSSSGQSVSRASPGMAREASVALGTASTAKKDFNNGSTLSQVKKGLAEVGSSKQPENNTAVQQLRGKYTLASPSRSAVKTKPLEETIELEERELQAMLTNAWKINEKRERKKAAAAATRPPQESTTVSRTPQESTTVSDSRVEEFHVKEGKRQPNNLSKPALHQQGSQNKEDKEEDLHWKSWRKYSNKERKELPREWTKTGYSHESLLRKPPGSGMQGVIQERVENPAKLNGISEAEDSFDPEEIVKVVTEEMSANSLSEGSDIWASAVLKKNSSQREVEGVEIFGNEQPLKPSKDEDGAVSALSSVNGSMQDLAHYGEQQEVLLSEGVEDIDSIIALDTSLEGFHDIEGETMERRKARWVRHLRAKKRAAKALEEIQQRDAEVQRQQEEKQQLAEIADRQIKRWATGKEGNLRALLSNLQHVLWAESGWQPISLADLIEGPDVKKAYRKATLFVHPDKVQQKGATLQQKYIAERVFDILQEAWKTFNLQELF